MTSLSRGRVQQVAATAAAVCLGFYFGVQYTGRTAYQPAPFTSTPAWVGEVQTAGWLALAGFGIAIVGAALLDVSNSAEGDV